MSSHASRCHGTLSTTDIRCTVLGMTEPISFTAPRPTRLMLLTMRDNSAPIPDRCELATPEDLYTAGFIEKDTFEKAWRAHFEAGGVSFDKGAGATIRYMLECMMYHRTDGVSDHAVEALKRVVTIINDAGPDLADPEEADGKIVPLGSYNLGWALDDSDGG